MKTLVTMFLLSNNVFIARANEKMRDINFYYDNNYKRKITFTSLLSYMYYELLEDYVNGYYPYQCDKCNNFFLSRKINRNKVSLCGLCTAVPLSGVREAVCTWSFLFPWGL